MITLYLFDYKTVNIFFNSKSWKIKIQRRNQCKGFSSTCTFPFSIKPIYNRPSASNPKLIFRSIYALVRKKKKRSAWVSKQHPRHASPEPVCCCCYHGPAVDFHILLYNAIVRMVSCSEKVSAVTRRSVCHSKHWNCSRWCVKGLLELKIFSDQSDYYAMINEKITTFKLVNTPILYCDPLKPMDFVQSIM